MSKVSLECHYDKKEDEIYMSDGANEISFPSFEIYEVLNKLQEFKYTFRKRQKLLTFEERYPYCDC